MDKIMKELRLRLQETKHALFDAVIERAKSIIDKSTGSSDNDTEFDDILFGNYIALYEERDLVWTVIGIRKDGDNIVLLGYDDEHDEFAKYQKIPFEINKITYEDLDLLSYMLDNDMYTVGLITVWT